MEILLKQELLNSKLKPAGMNFGRFNFLLDSSNVKSINLKMSSNKSNNHILAVTVSKRHVDKSAHHISGKKLDRKS